MKHSGNRPDGTPARTGTSPAKARKELWKKTIVDLYLKGNSMRDVVHLATDATGGHKFALVTVHKYINEAIEGWRQSKSQLIENHKDIELEKINRLEATYWQAWERSCKETRTKTTTKTKAKDGRRLAVAQVEEGEDENTGDPQFLKGVQWCIEQRCKILGIESAANIALQINNQTTTNNTSNQTTIVRRIVFNTRETTAAPQTFELPNHE